MPLTRMDIDRYFRVGENFQSVTGRATYEIQLIDETGVRIQPTAAATPLKLNMQEVSIVFDHLDIIDISNVSRSVYDLLRQHGISQTTTEPHLYAFAREYRERVRNAEQQRLENVVHAPLPEEISETAPLHEGATSRVTINAYERSPEARRRCIAAHGTSCSICDFRFGESYGEVAEGFIHVHHLRPLSEIRGEYEVDPVNDLRPVCPNCHAVLHRRSPAFSIDEVRVLLRGRVLRAVSLDHP